jgi:hypothetical protein
VGSGFVWTALVGGLLSLACGRTQSSVPPPSSRLPVAAPSSTEPTATGRSQVVVGRIACTGNPTAGTALSCGVGDSAVYFLRDDVEMHLVEEACLQTVGVQGETEVPCEIHGVVHDSRLVSVTSARLLATDAVSGQVAGVVEATPGPTHDVRRGMLGQWMPSGTTCLPVQTTAFREGSNLEITRTHLSGFEWACTLEPPIKDDQVYRGDQICDGDGMDGSRRLISIEVLRPGQIRITDEAGVRVFRRCESNADQP